MTIHDPTPDSHAGEVADPVPLDGLRRTMPPPPAVEKRVVRALRREGLLGRAAPTRWTRGWLAAAVAAGIALFSAGLAVGQAMGGRATLETVMALRTDDAGQHAAQLQRTGTLYVQAMTSLEGGPPSDEGREVALATLRAAATELARLYPDDARIAALLSMLDDDRAAPGETRSVIWF